MKEPMYDFRNYGEKVNLFGNKCRSCGEIYYPKRNICPKCGKTEFDSFKISGKGEIYSYTKIEVPPEDFADSKSYYAAIIKLEDGPLINGILVDPKNGFSIDIGDKVIPSMRKIKSNKETGTINYQIKFEDIGKK